MRWRRAPVLAVDTPLDGDVVLDAPTIEGSSEPGATVAVTLPDGTVVTTPLSEWDTIFTLALVIKFAPETE